MKFTKGRLFAILFACFLIYSLFSNEDWILYMQTLMSNFDGSLKEKAVILLYTSWNLEEYWSNLNPKKLDSHFHQINCSVKDCEISYDKDMLPMASAVLFHGQDLGSDNLYSPWQLKQLSRPLSQIWIWVNQESPMNIKNAKDYNGLFNWTATYHRRSDIVLPYGQYIAFQTDNDQESNLKKIIKAKSDLIAWVVSDCGGKREKIALELEKYLSLTVFGNCKTKFKNQANCLRGTKECDDKLSKFKFYLAFENSLCEDYVTEKYWINALEHGSVPVVYGYNYDAKIAIPKSYINVKDFKTVKDLAKFIQFLDTNDEYYAKYFDWRRKYKAMKADDLLCTVCKKLHDFPLQRRVYDDLGLFWSEDIHCMGNQEN